MQIVLTLKHIFPISLISKIKENSHTTEKALSCTGIFKKHMEENTSPAKCQSYDLKKNDEKVL